MDVEYLGALGRETLNFYKKHIEVSCQEVTEIMNKTRTDKKLWHQVRYVRISASSRPHKIKTSRKKQCTANEMLTRSHVCSAAMAYGKRTEATVIATFKKKTGKNVPMGTVILKNQPWLCCTPDGVCGDGLLEVKCPASRKNSIIVDYEKKVSTVSYLLYKDGELILRECHMYYTQIQVPFDAEFIATLDPKLKTFYFVHFLPLLARQVLAV